MTATRFDTLSVDSIDVSDENVRKHNIDEKLDDLAENIKTNGLLQPVVVYQDPQSKRYKLIVGQRRFLACRDRLGWRTIPARILAPPDSTQAALLSFSENIHRLDLEYQDKMAAAARLLNQLGSVKKVAKALGVSDPTVRNYLGYAGVPDALKTMVDEGKISATTALNIARTIPDEHKAVEIAKQVRDVQSADRKRLLIELAKENPTISADEVSLLIKKAKVTKVTIHLTARVAQALEAACTQYNSEPEDVARNAVEVWLEKERFLE